MKRSNWPLPLLTALAFGCSSPQRKAVELTCAPGQTKGADGQCATLKPAGKQTPGVKPDTGLDTAANATPALPDQGPSGSGTASEAVVATSSGSGSGGEPGSTTSASGTGSDAAAGGSDAAGSDASGSEASASGSGSDGALGSVATASGSASGSGSGTATATGSGPAADTAGFGAQAPTVQAEGAPWVAAKLVLTDTGEHELRLAFSHLDDVSNIVWTVDDAPLRPASAAASDGSLVVDPFALAVNVSFDFNKATWTAGPLVVTRAELITPAVQKK